jgi:peptide/nickel transport system permease protein
MNSFYKFLIFRILSLIPTIFGVIVITFILSHVVPGNPARILVGPEFNQQEYLVIERELGLNKPLWDQFLIYLNSLAHFNLGYSFVEGNSVNTLIGEHFPASFELAIASMAISIPIALVTGIYSSLRANKAGDHGVRVFSLLAISMPVFWIEMIMIIVFYVNLGWAPAPDGQLSLYLAQPNTYTGMTILDSLLSLNFPDFINSLWHIVLPALGLSLAGIATISRVLRSSMLDVLNKDYMRTVFAIGLPKNIIVNQYALRNALLPAITVGAIQAGALMGGVVLTESVFSWQGMGLLAYQAILQLDYPTVMGVVLISALLFTLVNFAADLLYAYVDPRVRL